MIWQSLKVIGALGAIAILALMTAPPEAPALTPIGAIPLPRVCGATRQAHFYQKGANGTIIVECR